MYHPMRALEQKWNAHTPTFLHKGSKENIIFQLTLVAMIFLGFRVQDWVEERSQKREAAAQARRDTIYRENTAGQR